MKKKQTILEDSEIFHPTADPSEAEKTDTLSAEELTMLRAAMEQTGEDRSKLPPHDSSDKAQILRYAKKNKLVTAAVCIIVAALVIGLVIGVIVAVSAFMSRPNTGDFTIMLGGEKQPSVPYNHLVRDGVLYVDMRQIASYTGLIVSGSVERMQFTGSNNSFFLFENESEFAYINGEQIEIRVPAHLTDEESVAKVYIEDGQCLVPYRFLTRAISGGILLRLDTKTNTITVQRQYLPTEDEDAPKVGTDILFSSARFSVIPPEAEPPKYTYSYLTDITPYLNSLETKNLLLANKQNPLGPDFKPNVMELTCPTDGEKQSLETNAAAALTAMMNEMAAAGISDIFVTSSYRSYAQQNWLFYHYYKEVESDKHPDWTEEQIEAEIATYSSKPGESEHQTGLCIDFTADSIGGKLDNSFEETDAFAWLLVNAHQFGFILRYPQDKVDVTGYSYESWHFRFVGREAASDIYFGGLCLEEYLLGSQATES